MNPDNLFDFNIPEDPLGKKAMCTILLADYWQPSPAAKDGALRKVASTAIRINFLSIGFCNWAVFYIFA